MKKHNIWYISKYIAPTYAAKNQARGFLILEELARLGHSCSLFTSDSNHQVKAPTLTSSVYTEIVDNVVVHWIKTVKFKKSNSIKRVLSWFDFEWRLFRMPKKNLIPPDVVIVSSLSLLSIVNGIHLKNKYKCKLIFEIRDIWPLVLTVSGGYSKNNIFVRFLGAVEKLGYLRSDCIVGTMPNLTQHVKNITKKDIKTECIPQVLDPALLTTQPEPLPKYFIEQYIPIDKFIVCHAGSIGTDNYLGYLFECARLLSKNEKIHFLIIGEGDLKQKYQEDNNDLNNITFAPRVEKNQVQSVLKHVDVVYFSTGKSILWEYGQSLNKVIDYMFSAKPIIASFSGYPSMINEAQCGVYVPAENTLALKEKIEFFSNLPKDKLQEIGNNGKDWIVKNRNINTVAKEYLKIIDRLLA